MSAGEEIPEWMVEFPRSATGESKGTQCYTFYEEQDAREYYRGLTAGSSWADRVCIYRRTITVSEWQRVE